MINIFIYDLLLLMPGLEYGFWIMCGLVYMGCCCLIVSVYLTSCIAQTDFPLGVMIS